MLCKKFLEENAYFASKVQAGDDDISAAKGQKRRNDWKCPACGEIYRTIKLLM